jgi:hypothetical protein
MHVPIAASVIAICLAAAAADGDVAVAAAVQRKFDEIQNDKAKPGSVYRFTPAEINAWARGELPKQVPQGMRDPAVQFTSNGASGFAQVDFLKMQHSKGAKVNWLMARLIEGERPMRVNVEIKSGGGVATVFLRRVEISNVSASGTVLDFLVRTFFRPLYPQAHIDEQFEMGHAIDRVEITPTQAKVFIQSKRK